MEDSGYKLIARDSTLNRDHIWIFAESASWKVQSWFKLPKTPLSDHSPVGVMLDFYPLNSQ
jgi:hypothetical protein